MSSGGVFLLMSMPISNYLRFKNSMKKGCSILKNYGGRLLSSAPEVTVVEGEWPRSKTLAIFQFDSERNARAWVESEPEVKQPDYLDGVDMVIAPVKEQAPLDRCYYVVADIHITEPSAFVKEYVPKSNELADGSKSVAVTAACQNPPMLRGLWRPRMLVLNQWTSAKAYDEFHSSDKFISLKDVRNRTTRSTVVAFQNVP